MAGRSIDIALKADDQASAHFKKVADSVGDLTRKFDQMRASHTATNALLRGLGGSIGGLSGAFRELAGSAKELDLDRPFGRVEQYTASLSAMGKAANDLVGAFKGLQAGDPSGAIGAISGMTHQAVDSLENSTKQLVDVDKAVESRAIKFRENVTVEELEKRKAASAKQLKAVNARLDAHKEDPLAMFARDPFGAKTEVENLGRSRRTLLLEQQRFDTRLARSKELGRLSEAEENPHLNDAMQRGMSALLPQLNLRGAGAGLGVAQEEASVLFARMKAEIDKRRADQKDAENIRESNLTPIERLNRDTAEVDRLQGWLGKDTAAEARKNARLRFGRELGLDDEAPEAQQGPTRFSATQSRLLNRGQGFEDPATVAAKRQLDVAEQQKELLDKVEKHLAEMARDAGKPAVKIMPAGV